MKTRDISRVAAIAGLAVLMSGISAFAAPNLKVVNLNVTPTSIGQGQQATIQYMLGNNGNMDASGFKVAFYFSNDSIINSSDTLLATVDITTVPATTNLGYMSVQVTIPAGAMLGTRYVGAIADSMNAVVENDESDNDYSALVSIVGAPDLTVTLLTVTPTTSTAGGEIEVSYTVTNSGASPCGEFTTRLYFSDDPTINDADTKLAHDRKTTLAAGATTGTVVAMLNLPATALAGSRYIGAIADPSNTVAEADEMNNSRATAIIVTQPTCFGREANALDVCGGNGTCVALDTCECANGWAGAECTDEVIDEDSGTITDGASQDASVIPDSIEHDTSAPPDITTNTDLTERTDNNGDLPADRDQIAADVHEDDTGSAPSGGGCNQSGGSAAGLLTLLVCAFWLFARRRTA